MPALLSPCSTRTKCASCVGPICPVILGSACRALKALAIPNNFGGENYEEKIEKVVVVIR
jgi:hypothetical protein